MRTIAALLGVLVVAQAQQAPRQVDRVVRRTAAAPAGALEPLAVLNAERAWSDADAFWSFLKQDVASQPERRRDDDANLQRYVLRAIGRVEDPAQVRRLLALTGMPFAPVADAVAQSLYGFDPAKDPQLISDVAQALGQAAKGPPGTSAEQRIAATAGLARAMSHIVYGTAEQVGGMESLLSDLMAATASVPRLRGAYVAAVLGLEALARLNTRLVHYDDKTIERLAESAKGLSLNSDTPQPRLYAFMALVAARALDPDTERQALADDDWTIRRAATAALAGGGGGLDDDSRLVQVRSMLRDSNQ